MFFKNLAAVQSRVTTNNVGADGGRPRGVVDVVFVTNGAVCGGKRDVFFE